MSRRKDLQARLNQATGDAVPAVWDAGITRAVNERRRQQMAPTSRPAGSDTDRVQARLAEARAHVRREEKQAREARWARRSDSEN